MKTGISIFKKLMLGVLFMFCLIIIIFWVIYRLNINDIQTELKKNKISEVKFITLQLTNQFEQVLMNAITLSEDQSVRKYPYELEYGNLYSRHATKLMIIDKLSLNSTYTPWNNSITLYYPDFEETISSNPAYNIENYNPPTQTLNKWILHLEKDGSGYYSNLTQSHIGPLFIETRVSLDQLRRMIRQYTSGTPLLYDSYNNKTIQSEPLLLSEDIISRITPLITGDSGFLSLEVDGIEHIVTYMKSDMLDLYFIDYHPKHQFIKPIYRNNTLFISAIVVLLLISLIYSLVLRRQVRTPIIHLRKAITLFDRGDFSSRVSILDAEEFRMLGNSFNRMAENTQKLIEQVLVGELELKEARLKQFQAQINPHFLYNCLNYIQSKASIEDYESVTAMTLHLSAYYRYVHKIEHIDSTIREELRFVENYLSIIQLRKSTLTFSIGIPTELGTHPLPRMILQPLVENCVQHGIENSLGSGHIEIRARNDENSIQISIKDNGVGMSADKLSLIRQRMEESKELEDISGIGIRNVYQRLKLYFGTQAGLSITSSLSEGTCYTLTIQKQEEDYAATAIS